MNACAEPVRSWPYNDTVCGRFGLFHDGREVADLVGAPPVPVTPRYNVAPTQEALIARDAGDGVHLEEARWGLLPHWVKDPASFKATLFNARAETAAEKPSFRDAFRSSRCAVPISGFFEWRAAPEGGGKQPYWIRRRDERPLALAGLYSVNAAFGDTLTFTVLTSRPGPLMAQLHDRQPVILPEATLPAWLAPGRKRSAELAELLEPRLDDPLEAVPVSTAVNRPGNGGAELLEPVGEALRAG